MGGGGWRRERDEKRQWVGGLGEGETEDSWVL